MNLLCLWQLAFRGCLAWSPLAALHCQYVIRDAASDVTISCLLNGYVIRALYYESFGISSASRLSLVCLLCILDLATDLSIVFGWITIENGTF
jgi:hypothetical protein